MEIREVDKGTWDKFVEFSPQGTIFSTSKWGEIINAPIKYLGYYKDSSLLGGAACFDSPQPLTPFQGILVAPIEGKYTTIMSLHNEVARELIPYLPSQFANHYTFPDIRPFLWNGWSASVKYTYVVRPDLDNLEKDTRYQITHCKVKVGISEDIETFDSLYEYTFSRKGLKRPVPFETIKRIYMEIPSELWMAEDKTAGALLIRDSKRWYYILGASTGEGTSSKVVWESIKDKNEIDFVGCNNELISRFKRGFGGSLKCYFEVKCV